MIRLYVDGSSLKESIEYFESQDYASPEQLGLFFFFKSIGFSDKEYKQFQKISAIDEADRKLYLLNLYNLSGIFDVSRENGEKKCCLFPFSIKNGIEKDYFNPGTAFKGLLSRLRDTVDNTLVDDSKFLRKDDSDPDSFKFPRDYIQILRNSFLKGSRISLVHLTTWYFRFRGVDSPDLWLNETNEEVYKAFTRVCTKVMIDELNLLDEEISDLFYLDENEYIKFNTIQVKGEELRSYIHFKSGFEPEITELNLGGKIYMDEVKDISLVKTEELAQPSGKNINVESLKRLLLMSKQVVLYGAPGTSKSYITNAIKDDFYKTTMVQFHPNLNYEQFIGGFSVNSQGDIISKGGIFLDFCEQARRDTNHENKYLFIIDEINRGNVSKIFGEVILTLDREYTADLPMSVKWSNEEITNFSIPENVYIIATMNSADRSIALVDYAIRRRFAFVKFYPNYELLSSISDNTALPDIKPDVLLKSINMKLFDVIKDSDILLGHAYFIPKWAIDEATNRIKWSPDVLKVLFNYYVIPIIEEYTYGNSRYLVNILGLELSNRIEDTNLFIEALKKQFKVN